MVVVRVGVRPPRAAAAATTAGMLLLTAPVALVFWHPVDPGHWTALIAIGALAQAGQYCFLRAYRAADASVLAPVSYSSIVFATAAGWAFFAEVPTSANLLGAAVILGALLFVWWRDR